MCCWREIFFINLQFYFCLLFNWCWDLFSILTGINCIRRNDTGFLKQKKKIVHVKFTQSMWCDMLHVEFTFWNKRPDWSSIGDNVAMVPVLSSSTTSFDTVACWELDCNRHLWHPLVVLFAQNDIDIGDVAGDFRRRGWSTMAHGTMNRISPGRKCLADFLRHFVLPIMTAMKT